MLMIDLLMEAKKQALIAQLSELASQSNEDNLKYELSIFFQKLKEKVLHELHEYWKDDTTILLEGHLDLILAPIFESQQQYYNILRKYNIKEYRLGTKQGRRLVRIARKPLSSFKSESQNIKVNKLLNIDVNKDELFATNDWSQQRLLDQNFTASERTMNRVDQDINKIISDGYKSGVGVNKVAANIENRFNQLQSWESERIARTEMHNAHQMGIMNTYQEMGVEYTQWTSAHDSRVRGLKPKDKANHVKMDGEIIPLGGTFSNGLQYPGDTKGPIEEWINCRCGNVPFIMPDGYMAPPGKAHFKEKDLISVTEPDYNQLLNEHAGVVNATTEPTNNLQTQLKTICDTAEEAEIITKNLNDFAKEAKELDHEIMTVVDNDFKITKIFDGEKMTVEYPQDIIIKGSKDGLLMSVHNHPNKNLQMSIADVHSGNVLREKYKITYIDTDEFLMYKSKNVDKWFFKNVYSEDIEKKYIQFRQDNLAQFNKKYKKQRNKLVNKLNNNKISNEEMQTEWEELYSDYCMENLDKNIKKLNKLLEDEGVEFFRIKMR